MSIVDTATSTGKQIVANVTGNPVGVAIGAGVGAVVFSNHRIVGAVLGAAVVAFGQFLFTFHNPLSSRPTGTATGAAGASSSYPTGAPDVAVDPGDTGGPPITSFPTTVTPPADVGGYVRYPYKSASSSCC